MGSCDRVFADAAVGAVVVSAAGAERTREVVAISIAAGLMIALCVMPGGKRNYLTTTGYLSIIAAATVLTALSEGSKGVVAGAALGAFVTDTVPLVQLVFAIILGSFTASGMDSIIALTVIVASLMVGVLVVIFRVKPAAGIRPVTPSQPTNDAVVPLLM